jgi:[ribosomal protein S18]-alanine N-acetyltransferase
MTPEALAALHAVCFADAPRPWSAAAFADLLDTPAAIVICCAAAVVVGRVAGPEAELLTLAVHPDARQRGHARRLIAALEAQAAARGCSEL